METSAQIPIQNTSKKKELTSLLENNIRGGILSKSGDGYVKEDDEKKILFVHATNVFVWTTSESLLHVEKKLLKSSF